MLWQRCRVQNENPINGPYSHLVCHNPLLITYQSLNFYSWMQGKLFRVGTPFIWRLMKHVLYRYMLPIYWRKSMLCIVVLIWWHNFMVALQSSIFSSCVVYTQIKFFLLLWPISLQAFIVHYLGKKNTEKR